jgi:hypothetical protein
MLDSPNCNAALELRGNRLAVHGRDVPDLSRNSDNFEALRYSHSGTRNWIFDAMNKHHVANKRHCKMRPFILKPSSRPLE